MESAVTASLSGSDARDANDPRMMAQDKSKNRNGRFMM